MYLNHFLIGFKSVWRGTFLCGTLQYGSRSGMEPIVAGYLRCCRFALFKVSEQKYPTIRDEINS